MSFGIYTQYMHFKLSLLMIACWVTWKTIYITSNFITHRTDPTCLTCPILLPSDVTYFAIFIVLFRYQGITSLKITYVSETVVVWELFHYICLHLQSENVTLSSYQNTQKSSSFKNMSEYLDRFDFHSGSIDFLSQSCML